MLKLLLLSQDGESIATLESVGLLSIKEHPARNGINETYYDIMSNDNGNPILWARYKDKYDAKKILKQVAKRYRRGESEYDFAHEYSYY